MKLAEVKRKLQPGVSVTLMWHRRPDQWKEPMRSQLQSGEGVTRIVSRVQGNAITLRTEIGGESWLYWPKVAQFQSDDETTFTVLDETDGQPVMKYRINGAAEGSK